MSAMRKRMNIVGRTVPALALVLSLLPGCITEPDTLSDDSTNVVVQIVQMQATSTNSAGEVSEAVSDLFSDVCAGLGFQTGCGVFNDNGIVTMQAFPKDRAALSTGALGINSVQFERYRVTYVRADGLNTPGVDVPYPFDGAANFVVPPDGSDVERGFIVVRHQAKGESPLREISLSLTTLSVIAQVDFYGHDGSGRTFKVTGYLNITFADFADAP